jgi:hypothetical protein
MQSFILPVVSSMVSSRFCNVSMKRFNFSIQMFFFYLIISTNKNNKRVDMNECINEQLCIGDRITTTFSIKASANEGEGDMLFSFFTLRL